MTFTLPSGNSPTSPPCCAKRIAIFVAAVSIPPRLTGMLPNCAKHNRDAKTLEVLAGHHPMHDPVGAKLDQQRIDPAAVIANDDGALMVWQRQPGASLPSATAPS